jgi:hypothetical protein
MRLEKEEGLRIGRLFESECRRQLHILGYHVSPTCDQLGQNGIKAPMLEGPFTGYRLPDLDVMGNGDSFWIEAKYKTKITRYRNNGGELQHGIDWPNWCDYLKVCEISGRRGFLILGEGETAEIIAAPFSRLEKVTRFYDGDVHFKEGAAFWPRSEFGPFGHFNPQTGQMHFAFKPPRPNAEVKKLFRKDDAA